MNKKSGNRIFGMKFADGYTCSIHVVLKSVQSFWLDSHCYGHRIIADPLAMASQVWRMGYSINAAVYEVLCAWFFPAWRIYPLQLIQNSDLVNNSQIKFRQGRSTASTAHNCNHTNLCSP